MDGSGWRHGGPRRIAPRARERTGHEICSSFGPRSDMRPPLPDDGSMRAVFCRLGSASCYDAMMSNQYFLTASRLPLGHGIVAQSS